MREREREYKISFGCDYVKQWKLNTCENDFCVKCLEKSFHHDFVQKNAEKKKRKIKLRNYNAIKTLSLWLSCARWPSLFFIVYEHVYENVLTWINYSSRLDQSNTHCLCALSIEKFSWRRSMFVLAYVCCIIFISFSTCHEGMTLKNSMYAYISCAPVCDSYQLKITK